MIVITGESHLGAIVRGAPRNAGVTFWPLGAGKLVTTPFYTHDAAAAAVHTHVRKWRNRTFSLDTLDFNGAPALLALSLPLNTSRILRDHAWDTHVPWRLKKSPDEVALSDGVVLAIDVSESIVGSQRDVITDFDGNFDAISLRLIDANANVDGDQAFDHIGLGAFSGTAGEVRTIVTGANMIVAGDVDGDAQADFEILLIGVESMAVDDFIL